MSIPRFIYPVFSILLSIVGLFLSSWILIPPPNFPLLPLAIAAPELSPWLIALNGLAILLALAGARQLWWLKVGLGLSAIALVISLLPLSQFSATQQRAEAEFAAVVGSTADRVTQPWMRPRPLVLLDVFRGIPSPAVRHTANIPFANPDQTSLLLDIYRPLQTGQYPALVVIYGGGWQNGSPQNNADFSRYMAAQGYVVWAISYRHAPQYQFPAQLLDIQAALTFIQKNATEYETDPTRIALVGRSAGAHLAMLTAYQPDAVPIRAVVNYYGPVDLLEGYTDLPNPDPLDVRKLLREFVGGTPEQVGDRYRTASPITYVTRPLPPTLSLYGTRDHIVLAKFGRQLSQQLQQTNTPSIFIELPWAEHAFDTLFSGISSQLSLYYVERFLAWALK